MRFQNVNDVEMDFKYKKLYLMQNLMISLRLALVLSFHLLAPFLYPTVYLRFIFSLEYCATQVVTLLQQYQIYLLRPNPDMKRVLQHKMPAI